VNVQEGGSFANEFWSERWFGIEVGIKVFGEDVDKVEDLIFHGFSDVAVLDECILGVPWEE